MNLDWDKVEGLVPAIIQDASSREVLMLGYMNQESFLQTLQTGLVTFYSRTKKRVWCKGETSGNTLKVVEILPDCDQDTLLIRVIPKGPTCHRETPTCFDSDFTFLTELQSVIQQRIESKSENSYVAKLIESGLDRVIQKVGEEAVETVIAAKNQDLGLLENEAADLLFHLMVLLQEKNTNLANSVSILKKRHSSKIN